MNSSVLNAKSDNQPNRKVKSIELKVKKLKIKKM